MPSHLPCFIALIVGSCVPTIAWAGTSSSAESYGTGSPEVREMSTDRPDKTESPITVAPGKFQIEAELFSWTRNREQGSKIDAFDVGVFNFKYGLLDHLDLQVMIESYHYEKTRKGSSQQVEEGFGDLTLRAKMNFWGNDGESKTALGLMPYVTLPTASHRAGVAKAEAGVILPFSWQLTERLGLGLMTEVDWVNEDEGGHTWNWVNSITLGVALTEKLGTYLEWYTEVPMENRSAWVATVDAGLTYAINDNVQWDVGVNVGVTDAADDLQVFTGITVRF